jgi:hypothetical protein
MQGPMMDDLTLLTPDRAPSIAAAAELRHAPALVPAANAGSQEALDFIKTVFGPTTEAPVWIMSLGNDRDGDEAPRHIATRDMAVIDSFITKWDRAERGLFFCVSTIDGAKRNKDNVAEIVGLHIDIDFKDIDDTAAEVDRKLASARCPPSFVNASGNGRHCFWLFKEALAGGADNQARVETALKLVCDLFGGDQVVTQCVALMRLPGTHNTKFGRWAEVTTIANSGIRYELDDLEEWLSEVSPVILRKVRPAIVTDNNPFLEAAKAQGFKPSIDVEKRLKAMSYMGGSEAAIHTTQLCVSASLLTGGMDTDEVVKLILDATRGAAAGYGERWNWTREESAIRRMCSDWLRKHPVAPERQAEAKAAAATAEIKSRPVEIFWHGTEYNRAARLWLIKELIPESGAGLASGQWGTAKTFAMLDMAASIMTGTPFAGRDVNRRGGVLFIAAEGANEIPIRLQGVVEQKLKPAAMAAVAAGEPLDANLERLPFAWIEDCPSLKEDASFEKLASIAISAAEQITEQFSLPLALIVIDTLSASADFADANDAAEGQRIMNRLNALSRLTGAFVLAVDHFGKDVTTGTRGTTAKEGAADVVLALLAERAVNGTVTNTRMAVRKLRGGQQGIETPFNLMVVDAGDDETTCIIEWKPSKAKGTNVKEKWTKSLKVFRASMTTAIIEHGADIRPFGSEGALVRAAALDRVRSEFMAAYPADNADAKRKAFDRSMASARERDLICSREIGGIDQVWIVEVQNG